MSLHKLVFIIGLWVSKNHNDTFQGDTTSFHNLSSARPQKTNSSG